MNNNFTRFKKGLAIFVVLILLVPITFNVINLDKTSNTEMINDEGTPLAPRITSSYFAALKAKLFNSSKATTTTTTSPTKTITTTTTTTTTTAPVVVKTEYNTIADLKKANLTVGLTVTTLGYSTSGDLGGAKYLIVSDSTVVTDEFLYIQLNNGLKAKLIYDSTSTVNVATAGIFINQNISDRLNTVITALAGKASGIKFNDGIYFVDKPVNLFSLNYIGTGNTVLSVSKSFTTSDDKVFVAKPTEKYSAYSMTFKGLNFLFETATDHALYGKEIVLISLSNIDSCVIDSCTIVSKPAFTNGAYMKTDLLWFKNSDFLKNISITNSTIQNLTGSAYTGGVDDYLVGGCIWFNGKTDNYIGTMDNISINNCKIETTVSDEAVCAWWGNYSNFSINNSVITNSSHTTHNLLTFDKGEFHNVSVNGTTFNLNSASIYVTKLHSLTNASDISYNTCSFNFDAGVTSSSTQTIGVFFAGSDLASYGGNTSISVQGCQINSSMDTTYRSLFAATDVQNKTYNLTNSTVNANLVNGLILLSNSNANTFNVSGNVIDTKNALMTVNNSFADNLNVTGNTIANKATVTINQAGTVNYVLTQNNFTAANCGILFNTNGVAETNGVSNFTFSDNTFTSESKLYYFYSNTLADQADLLTIIQ